MPLARIIIFAHHRSFMPRKAESDTPIKARLFIDAVLAGGCEIAVAPGQAHYLRSVLRLMPGQSVGLFNGHDGEWRAELTDLRRSSATLRVAGQRRTQQASPDIQLCFAPLKKSAIDIVGTKATELGVSRLTPVVTQWTAVSRINIDRLRANAIEAAEQCERLDIPTIDAPQTLESLLAAWPKERPLLVCAEAGNAMPIVEVASALPRDAYGLLVGPEGGFSPKELDRLNGLAFVQPVGLGPRILRADTAAIAALAICVGIGGNLTARPPHEAAFYSKQTL